MEGTALEFYLVCYLTVESELEVNINRCGIQKSQMSKALDLRTDFKETIRHGIASIYLNISSSCKSKENDSHINNSTE